MGQQLSGLAVLADKWAQLPVLKWACNYPLLQLHRFWCLLWQPWETGMPVLHTLVYRYNLIFIESIQNKIKIEAGRKWHPCSARIQMAEVLMSWILLSWERKWYPPPNIKFQKVQHRNLFLKCTKTYIAGSSDSKRIQINNKHVAPPLIPLCRSQDHLYFWVENSMV